MMSQLLARVQTWLGERPAAPSPAPAAADEAGDESPAGTGASTGFVYGLGRADVIVELGMSPAEYVCSGLESAGGRLRQQEICARTGWSEATVSRTLGEMEESELVFRIRLGRENLVCLPDAVPGRQSPPLDD